MDVSVVIVNYKVKDLLERCLASVYRETRGVTFEVFVVDNDSRDGSAQMVREKFPQATLIASPANVGFAAANNMAMKRASGDFIIWLNPDCELREDALTRMVAWMRENPRAAIAGPRLLNEDGSLQRSVRRLPGLADQALVLLKLHNLFPKLRPLARYFADDFDYDASGQAEQVMGAAFMLRRSTYEKLGGMDERFFLWFEEVDYCKTARDAGLEVWYTPAASIVHRGGTSFGQLFAPKKQRILNESMRKYFMKHFGAPKTVPLYLLHPLSMLLARAVSAVRGAPAGAVEGDRFFLAFERALVAYVAFEALSYAAFFHPALGVVLFAAIVGGVAWLTFRKPMVAALVVLAELFIGSQGGAQLFVAASSGISVSLRLGIFLAFFTSWCAVAILEAVRRPVGQRTPDVIVALRRGRLLWPLVALAVVVAMGAIRGAYFGNGFANVFFDGNAWLYLALFLPLLAVLRDRAVRVAAAGTLAAAAVAMVGKAMVIHYFFSHRLQRTMVPLYLWIRDTRVGEITRMAGDFYRIFFQSEFFLLPAGFVAVVAYAFLPKTHAAARRFAAFIAWVSVTGLLMSLSRSFWFGVALAALAYAGFLLWTRAGAEQWRRSLVVAASGVVVAVASLAAVYAIPFPGKGEEFSLTDLLSRRALSFSGEAAANSRWALLPKLMDAVRERPILGSGLGRAVTYTTSDPRLLADNPTGEYTTYAFEWGYHDIWLKFGVVGLCVVAWLLARIHAPILAFVARRRASFRAEFSADAPAHEKTALVAVGLLLASIAVLGTNVFSPYLNHPLGIGFLILLAAFALYDCGASTEKEKPLS